jgi:alpha-galactosidase
MVTKKMLLLLFLTSFTLSGFMRAQAPVVAQTPPMGWNSWNHFAEKVDDGTVRAAADALVSSGMRDAGYLYVNIDDTWEGKRDARGVIHPNDKFPDMKALADYVHAKGLKLGIYSSPGPKTCAGYEGSLSHEEQDARTYAEWGVDYLKYDLCSYDEILQREAGSDPAKAQKIQEDVYRKMREALQKTGRPIVLSLCQYGWAAVWRWGASAGGNLWRTTDDIEDNWNSMSNLGFGQNGLERFAGPGHWNDPDMLEIGNGGMNDNEYKTHMTLWSLLAAPLIAGNDLSHMTPETLSILTNREVIAVDQDKKGVQGHRIWQQGPLEIWTKPLADGSLAVGLFNRGGAWMTLEFNFADASLQGEVALRDLWSHQDLGTFSGRYAAMIPSHGVQLLRVTPHRVNGSSR